TQVGFGLAQVGEFSFIIAALGMTLHATTQPVYPIIIAVSAITTFTTPYLIKFSGHSGQFLDAHLSHRARYFLSNYSAWVYRSLGASGKSQNGGTAKIFLNGVIVAIIFTLTQYWILPYLDSKSLVWLIALGLSSPFIWGMLSATRGKAVFASGLVTIVEISALSMAYFQTWLISIILVIVAIAFFRILYTRLDKSYKWFENRWLHNFENRSSREFFYRELAPWDTQLRELHVSHQSPLLGKTLEENKIRDRFEVNIVAIYRDNEMIVSPRGHHKILAHDVLIALGHDEKMDEFVALIEKIESPTDEVPLLEKFTLTAIVLEEESEYIGKSIRDSHIREKINGLLVGLERGSVRTLNPDVTIILEAGDLLLLVGEAERLTQIL
ncbi:MAG: TrkA C-terminal domain-containing protein, partial [Gammaproteobacteria bacterium]